MSQSIRHPRSVERDELARLTEQSAVRDMRAALAEAGLLDDEYHDRIGDRWQLVNDAVDRVCLAYADRREATLEHYLTIAARLAAEHPFGFAKALFNHVTGRGE